MSTISLKYRLVTNGETETWICFLSMTVFMRMCARVRLWSYSIRIMTGYNGLWMDRNEKRLRIIKLIRGASFVIPYQTMKTLSVSKERNLPSIHIELVTYLIIDKTIPKKRKRLMRVVERYSGCEREWLDWLTRTRRLCSCQETFVDGDWKLIVLTSWNANDMKLSFKWDVEEYIRCQTRRTKSVWERAYLEMRGQIVHWDIFKDTESSTHIFSYDWKSTFESETSWRWGVKSSIGRSSRIPIRRRT